MAQFRKQSKLEPYLGPALQLEPARNPRIQRQLELQLELERPQLEQGLELKLKLELELELKPETGWMQMLRLQPALL